MSRRLTRTPPCSLPHGSAPGTSIVNWQEDNHPRIDRIHILGASGSGTTTLGRALSEGFGYSPLDTDNYFWEPTTPPFQRPRAPSERHTLLAAALETYPRWVLSGALCGWGDIFISRFDLVIFLWVPTESRLARLQQREAHRYGTDVLAPGGARHAAHVAFMSWAATYDEGSEDRQSRGRHETWLAALPCPYLRLAGPLALAEQLSCLKALLVKS